MQARSLLYHCIDRVLVVHIKVLGSLVQVELLSIEFELHLGRLQLKERTEAVM